MMITDEIKVNDVKKDWLNSRFPQDQCPYCGEDSEIDYCEDRDGFDPVIFWATCGCCKKTWGQVYHMEFDCNIEWV